MEVITTHINADFDCLGGMIAAKKLYPKAEMVFAGSQERSLREFFLHSASYAYAFKRVKDIDLDRVTRLILVDVREPGRIGPFEDVARRSGVEIHIYDHHQDSDEDHLSGVVEVIEPVGSTVTVFSHLFMERGIHPNADEATLMMLGLYEDTGSLMFSSTTVKDFQAAAFLLEHGANLTEVADFLTYEMTPEQVRLLHDLLANRMVLNIHGYDVSVAHASVDQFVGDLAVLTHKLRDMENLRALITVVRMGDRIFMVGRSSLPEVHVGEILSEFGGGGHAFAASATVRDLTLVQVLDRLASVLKRQVNPRLEVRHLMSHPVKTVAPDESIEHVREFLTRYNINAVPVVEGDCVLGLLTRQVVERAAHHGLGDVAAREYMESDFATVEPEDPIDILQDLIVRRNQRFVPVMSEGQLIGAITRTDLLRYMVDRAPRSEGGREPAEETAQTEYKPREVIRLLRNRLPERIQDLLEQIGRCGDELGVKVFVVGGFVRDLLLDLPNLDLDIVVEGDGIAFAEHYARQHQCRVRAHQKFGTAVIVLPDEFKVDVASTRVEFYLEPAALPTVENASIKLDLYRRDFTINTLAISLNGERFGEIHDFFGGLRDLRQKAIRVLHNLSFVEDPTRVFRAVRFEQRLEFHIGKQTEHLIRSAVRMGFLERLGGPRLLSELQHILEEEHPYPAIERLSQLDLLKFLHPSLDLPVDCEDLFDRATRSLNWFDLLYTEESCQRWLVYLLCLVTRLDDDAMQGLCDRLSIPGRYRSLLADERHRAHGVLKGMRRRWRQARRKPRNSDLYVWFEGFSIETLLYLMARIETEDVRRWVSLYVTRLRDEKSWIDGEDLKKMGIPPGPQYKEILRRVLLARLDGKATTREEEIAFVTRRYRSLIT
ncbi:CBS domain-containing protein [Geoalkalibacter subterraneus]|uniref:Polya polymerase n=1 Tax=Geoalkalibacter subterraneus TaxID=483547 RepID=A0A0B5FDV7_9BACT|nr:CBS domain-containing protein [Geoalkalibacter subterraneus]AJF06347.1 polya polymerase [Geoalkalibacter subterraneus]